jgi:diguanylate cyclase (GGDEF)-like protein
VAPSWRLIAERIHPDDYARVRDTVQRNFEARTPYHTEFRVVMQNGELRHYRLHGTLLRDASGTPTHTLGTTQDISEQKAIETELTLRTAYLEAIIKHMPQGVSVFDETLHLKYWNDEMVRVLELPPEIVVRDVSFDDLIRVPARRGEYGSDDPEVYVAQRRALAMQFNAHRFERKRLSGKTHLVDGRPLFIDERIAGFITTYTDISELKDLETRIRQNQETLQSIIDNIPSGISLIDAGLRFVAWNDKLLQLLELPAALFDKDHPPTLEEVFRLNAERGEYGPGDTDELVAVRMTQSRAMKAHVFERTRPNGTVIEVRGMPLHDGGFVTVYTDITERKAAEARIHHLAHHDALTGLSNRVALEARLEQALASADRHGGKLGLMFIDLDRFKNINDSLGHDVGDALLVAIAGRLARALRETDTAARFGGDEFVLVLPDIGSANDLVTIAGKIVDALNQPIVAHGHALHTSGSIGISIFPEDGRDVATLMKNADTAMYSAKASGRNTFHFYTDAMNLSASRRLDTETRLRSALEAQQFELYYQPLLRGDGDIAGLEALIRWRDPERGLIAPGEFIPVAEDSGLILPIGEWVIERACEQIVAWASAGLPRLRVSVNLSPRQLRSKALVPFIGRVLLDTGLPPDVLELEITESGILDTGDEAKTIMLQLREMGITLAIDDFGTGYSSLSHLKEFPVQKLKIDRSFVQDIETDPSDRAIAISTIALAHALGMTVVAEGVENAAQLAVLREHGCDELQGFLFSRPLPAAEIPGLIAGGRIASRSTR